MVGLRDINFYIKELLQYEFSIAMKANQCTIGKLQWEFGSRIFSFFEREIYLKYLDTDKMRG